MRLSDILKKINNPSNSIPSPEAAMPEAPAIPPVPPGESAAAQPESRQKPQNTDIPRETRAETAYTGTLSELKNIIHCVEQNTAFPGAVTCVSTLAGLVKQGDDDILALADRATPDVYLYSHSANDCIYALLIGTVLGIDGERLESLGCCALLHDLGMLKYLPVVLKKGKLSSTEFEQIRKHAGFGSDIVRLLPGLSSETKELMPEVIEQVHERADGSGYPSGRSLDDIHLYARIIAVADVYEALSHPRSYRERYLPHEALKFMVNSAEALFDPSLLKTFLERISLYPPGSYVRLNTGEIARVTGTNNGMPTRPRVKLVLDAHLQRIAAPRTVSLNQTPQIFISEAVDETKLAVADKKTLIELRARRWWVRGI